MAIVRVKRRASFVVCDQNTVRDSRLSWEARGLLFYLLSMADGWEIKPRQLIESGPAGRDKIYSIIEELVVTGYCERKQIMAAGGRRGGVEYTVFETPIFDDSGPSNGSNNDAVSPHPDLPDTVVFDRNSVDKPVDNSGFEVKNDQIFSDVSPHPGLPDTVPPDTVPPDPANTDYKKDQVIRKTKDKKTSQSAGASEQGLLSVSRGSGVIHIDRWYPGVEVVKALVEVQGVPLEFVESERQEFLVYWIDAGGEAVSWDSKFMQHVRIRWARVGHSWKLPPPAAEGSGAYEALTKLAYCDYRQLLMGSKIGGGDG